MTVTLANSAEISRIGAVQTILDVVCRTTGMGFAAVAQVTDDRWIACCVKDEIGFGLAAGGELKVETTLCHEVRQSREALIIDHVATDPVYCGHPTPAMYGFQSYLSMPIILPDGAFFGTLCALDPRPSHLRRPEVIGMFKLFAELIAFHLNAVDRLATTEARLSDEQRTAELREQFIAVLGHDLRNPLGAISAGAELLLKTPLTDRATRMVNVIRSSVTRMSDLIDDVLDFARGRLGSGLTVNHTAGEPLEPVLRHVVAELEARFPDRTIETNFSLHHAVICDVTRVSQLLSNLVGNALQYGAPEHPVRIEAGTDGQCFELSVANGGNPIPAAAMEKLFQPFSRGEVRPGQQGLGLGLFIAAEVARAHNGTLVAASSPQETRFTFRMKLAAPSAALVQSSASI